ncbi:MAG: hypothetical protein IT389_09040 [Nitrospira sp.]|nr:hypothetical protein [Nitrospira sp.]
MARLRSDGHECVTVSRGRNAAAKHIRLNIAKAERPEDWRTALDGVDAVVNTAGALQDSAGQSAKGMHVVGIDALYRRRPDEQENRASRPADIALCRRSVAAQG